MKQINTLMYAATEQINTLVEEALNKQRSMIAGEPEKEIRLLALEQMAQYYDKEAMAYYRGAETYEAEECKSYAKKAREFADRIRTGKHP